MEEDWPPLKGSKDYQTHPDRVSFQWGLSRSLLLPSYCFCRHFGTIWIISHHKSDHKTLTLVLSHVNDLLAMLRQILRFTAENLIWKFHFRRSIILKSWPLHCRTDKALLPESHNTQFESSTNKAKLRFRHATMSPIIQCCKSVPRSELVQMFGVRRVYDGRTWIQLRVQWLHTIIWHLYESTGCATF